MMTLRQAVLTMADHWEGSARASKWLIDRAGELRSMVDDAKTDASDRELEQLIAVETYARRIAGYTVDDCDDDYQAVHAALVTQLEHLDAQRKLDATSSAAVPSADGSG